MATALDLMAVQRNNQKVGSDLSALSEVSRNLTSM